MLFDSGKFALSKPKNLNAAQRIEKSTEEFEHCFEGVCQFLETAYIQIEKTWYKIVAFQLYQATERFYSAILLVFTDYKPKIHDIELLGNQVKEQNANFASVFPRTTDEEDRLFILLKRAYIDARYDKNFKIEKEELEYLGGRVALL